MSVPKDQMLQLMNQQGSMPGNAPDGGASDMPTAPMSAPMSTPEPKLGNKEGALVNLSMALDLIEQSLPALGSETEEGQKAMAALRTLTAIIGPKKQKTNSLQSTEILQMLQNLPQAGGATPEGRAMMQAPPVPNMPPMGGAGGSPPAAPGGAPPAPGMM